MVLRFTALGVVVSRAIRSVPGAVGCALAVVWSSGVSLGAQETVPSVPQNPAPAPAVAPATAQAPAPAQSPAPAEAPKYGRVVLDGARLRCWPGTAAVPPMFEDVLAKDQVVVLGRVENGFRAVSLPFGPIGYVSKKFTTVDADGKVTTKGGKVSFRYRPGSSEAPVTSLAESTPLAVLGEKDDWWRVRCATVESWLLETEVQAGDPADAALATAFAEVKAKHGAEVQVRLDQIAAQKQREAQDQLDLAAVQVVQEGFASELKKPAAEQQFGPLVQALDKVEGGLAAESAAKPTIAALRERIKTQSWIAEATILRDDKPVPAADAGTTQQPKDELERFQAIGWLRYEVRIAGPGVYFLEKGGRRQYVMSCNSGRYDLALFVDREVGVVGPRRRPVTESLSVLDVERIEVLGTTAR